MDKLEYVKTQLADYSTHKEVVFKAEISQGTIWNILKGERTPHKNTINTLYTYFKRREK